MLAKRLTRGTLCALSVLACASTAFGGNIVYVDDDAAHGGDGQSWDTAYGNIQNALGWAADPFHEVSEIRIAQGRYTPDEDSGDREASFYLLSNVSLRGGYAGVLADDPDERDIEQFETVLSGDLNGDDEPDFQNIEENSFHVVNGTGMDATAIIEGVTISGGNASWSTNDNDRGAGMYCSIGNPMISQCTFRDNYCKAAGGALHFHGDGATVSDCRFIHNESEASAGAVSAFVNLTFENCWFEDNTSDHNGGAVSVGDVSFINCVFVGNVGRHGGACRVTNDCSLINCLFQDNFSYSDGGALQVTDNCVAINCRFYDNHAEEGGAIINKGDLTLVDCTITGNSAELGGAVYALFGQLTVIDSRITANSASIDGGAIWAEEPISLINTTLADNTAALEGGGVWLDIVLGAATFSNSILWNNSDSDGSEQSSQLFVEQVDVLTVDYCCIQDLTGSLGGSGNIGDDPLFADPDGEDDILGTEDDDYRLASSSPCIDAADNTVVPPDEFDRDSDGDVDEPTPLDLDGNPRFVDHTIRDDTGVGTAPIVDMGAYEYQPAPCPWDFSGDGAVGPPDLGLILGHWGPVPPDHPEFDLDQNGVIGPGDLALILGNWGPCWP